MIGLKHSKDDIPDMERYISYLQAENEKLRKLVINVKQFYADGCFECPLIKNCNEGSVYDDDCAMLLTILQGAKELGIEVDG